MMRQMARMMKMKELCNHCLCGSDSLSQIGAERRCHHPLAAAVVVDDCQCPGRECSEERM